MWPLWTGSRAPGMRWLSFIGMTRSASAPPHAPVRYGTGLAVLVVGTRAEPFVSDPAPIPATTVVPSRTASDTPASPRVVTGQWPEEAPYVLLVDSGTPDGPPATDAPVLRIGEDVGRGAAVNRALAALPADVGLVAVAPPGLTWTAGALDALRAAASRHPRAGILAPRVCRPDGSLVPSAHPLPDPVRGAVAVLRGRSWPPADPDPAAEGPVGWSSSPGLLLRRAALDSVGGFDPRYPGRLDDLDLADRSAAAGWLTVHVPSAEVVHAPAPRPDPSAARRYLAARSPRPVRALLRARPA